MDNKEAFEKIWKEGTKKENVPAWAKFRKIMASEFPRYYKVNDGEKDPLAQAIADAVTKVDSLKPNVDGPAYLGDSSALTYNYPDVKNAKVPEKPEGLDKVVDDAVNLFQGMPNVASPLTMSNVWPQPNTASIIASTLPLIFMPNIIEGEYCWNVHKAELESAGMIANMFNWAPTKAGCVYTYGGSGCWFYGLKYALTRVLPDSRQKGVRTDGKVLCSAQSHYCRDNATDWTGLGMDNVELIPTDTETNQMDLKVLEEKLKEFTSQGIPVISVVCTMGTTDASVFDPIEDVRRLLDKYPNPAPYGKALLYADAVAGWSWIFFKDYDFEKNPLNFSAEVLRIAKRNYEQIKGIHYADAIGCDFHKFGWSPYVSSCFVYKDAAEFESIMRRGSYAYLQEVTPYNPMYYTLEVSRSGAGAVAGWATMKYFGVEGFQALLGGMLEVRLYMDALVKEHPSMVMADPDNTGFITLFRVYPEGVDAKKQFERELNDPAYRADLLKNNEITEAIGEKLFDWYLQGKKVNGKFTPHMAYSTGFRNAAYNADGTDDQAVVYALKAYPMNIYCDPQVMRHALDCVMAARDEVLAEFNGNATKVKEPELSEA